MGTVGSPVAIVTLAWLDAFLQHHYDIDLATHHSVDVTLWGFHSFADDDFVRWYTDRWGRVTDAYTDRGDVFSDTIALFGAKALTEVRGHVASAVGSCGVVSEKRMSECVSFCPVQEPNLESCYRWWTNALFGTLEAHELNAFVMLPREVIPDTLTSVS